MDFAAAQKKYDIGTFAHQVMFPGDHSPVVMHDLLRAANAFDFEIIAVHNDRHSYYLTTRAWAQRLEAARDVVVEKFGARAFRSFRALPVVDREQHARRGRPPVVPRRAAQVDRPAFRRRRASRADRASKV